MVKLLGEFCLLLFLYDVAQVVSVVYSCVDVTEFIVKFYYIVFRRDFTLLVSASY